MTADSGSSSDPTFLELRALMHESCGALQAVFHVTDPHLPRTVDAVVLCFEHGEWTISVQPEDDTVSLSGPAPVYADGPRRAEVPANSPWRAGYGMWLFWIWALQNQAGYLDGIQLSFGMDGAERCSMQVIAMASRLSEAVVLPC